VAVAGAEGDNSTGDGDTADGVGAVANPILEVDVLAQAGGVSVGTTKGGSQSDHVVHAELLRKCEPWCTRNNTVRKARCKSRRERKRER
jgi:hypothetical protein